MILSQGCCRRLFCHVVFSHLVVPCGYPILLYHVLIVFQFHCPLYLAAQSSFRSLVICLSVGLLWKSGEILLGGKCPFVRTKKLSGQKNGPDKKIVRIKKLSGQKNCPDKKNFRTKKLSGQKNCPDKKIVRTKKKFRTKNGPDSLFQKYFTISLEYYGP